MVEKDIYEVLKRLPQRYPVLMIDRVKECEPGKRIVALKNVSANEPHFQGHFPGRPIMPGVLILEAMAQAAGVLVFSGEGAIQQSDRQVYYYVGIDVESKGVELEAAGQLNEYVDLVVGFTALKLEDEQGAEIYTWVPRRTANMVLSSRIPGFDQLHLGLNGRWQSDIWTVDGTNGGVVRQDSYATLNLFAGWDVTPNANIRVNANNITDEKYIGSLYQVGFYAAPANYTVTFGYKF